VPERMLTWAYTENKQGGDELFWELVKGATGSTAPITETSSLLPPLIKVTVENQANYNFFRGQSIYPQHLDGLPPEMRHTKYTSEMAIVVGEKIGVSPSKIENAVRGLTGGSGGYVMDAGDKLLNQFREWNGEVIPEDPVRQSDTPLLRAFIKEQATGNRSQSAMDFYDLSVQVEQARRAYNKLKGREKADFKAENMALFRTERYVKAKMKMIRRLNKRRNTIYDNVSLSGKQKTEMLKNIEDQITRHATLANERFLKNLKDLEK